LLRKALTRSKRRKNPRKVVVIMRESQLVANVEKAMPGLRNPRSGIVIVVKAVGNERNPANLLEEKIGRVAMMSVVEKIVGRVLTKPIHTEMSHTEKIEECARMISNCAERIEEYARMILAERIGECARTMLVLETIEACARMVLAEMIRACARMLLAEMIGECARMMFVETIKACARTTLVETIDPCARTTFVEMIRACARMIFIFAATIGEYARMLSVETIEACARMMLVLETIEVRARTTLVETIEVCARMIFAATIEVYARMTFVEMIRACGWMMFMFAATIGEYARMLLVETIEARARMIFAETIEAFARMPFVKMIRACAQMTFVETIEACARMTFAEKNVKAAATSLGEMIVARRTVTAKSAPEENKKMRKCEKGADGTKTMRETDGHEPMIGQKRKPLVPRDQRMFQTKTANQTEIVQVSAGRLGVIVKGTAATSEKTGKRIKTAEITAAKIVTAPEKRETKIGTAAVEMGIESARKVGIEVNEIWIGTREIKTAFETIVGRHQRKGRTDQDLTVHRHHSAEETVLLLLLPKVEGMLVHMQLRISATMGVSQTTGVVASLFVTTATLHSPAALVHHGVGGIMVVAKGNIVAKGYIYIYIYIYGHCY
jgi:hypothetical protein